MNPSSGLLSESRTPMAFDCGRSGCNFRADVAELTIGPGPKPDHPRCRRAGQHTDAW